MTDANNPGKPPPQPTVQWDPEEFKDALQAEGDGSLPHGPTQDDPLVGQLLRGKWRVLKRLGAGSYGTVYKVRDEKGGWIEALKILGVDRITGAEAENVRARFLREAQIMKRLGAESPHIVGLSTYEEDIEAGLIYFLMEFVDGKSLGDLVQEEGPFSVEKTLRIALQVCDALAVAHEGPEGVVHRDLKLENIMITRDRGGQEIAKVLDFGIAKVAEREADSRLTAAGALGTPGYAAPEQLRAETVDARTDLFAFGVILYALLTGRDPWLGHPAGQATHQVYDLMVATERGEVRPMGEAADRIPPALVNVVLKLLKRDPDQRFSSAVELRMALERIAQGGSALDAASLRVLTEEAGVQVAVYTGRKVLAKGPTPLSAAGLAPGSYKVTVEDPAFAPLETTVVLGPGAMEDVTLAPMPGKGGRSRTPSQGQPAASSTTRARNRRWILVAAGTAGVLLLGSVAVIQPWGRSLEFSQLVEKAEAGGISWASLAPTGIRGRLAVGPIPAPFRVQLPAEAIPEAVSTLARAGVAVDTSWEVARLVALAAEAQRRMRYYTPDGGDVRSYALQAAALAPDRPEPRSLLLKVAERMAWDAEALEADGDALAARALANDCLELVPGHPGCAALQP